MEIAEIKVLSKKATAKKATLACERLQAFSAEQLNYLSCLSVVNEHLDAEEITTFLNICGYEVTFDISIGLIKRGLAEYIFVPKIVEGEPTPAFLVEIGIKKDFLKGLSDEEMQQRHSCADKFYRNTFLRVLDAISEDGESSASQPNAIVDELSNFIIAPGGLIDFGAHYLPAFDFHNWSITKAYYWQEHLFALGKFEESANITNSICFALARKGHKNIAKEMLARNTAMTTGIHSTISIVNLATLLREDQEHKLAQQFYRRSLFPLLKYRAFPQLAAVFSEMSNINRDYGYLGRAIVLQHLSELTRSLLKDHTGMAICKNQLSILYRSLRFYKLAMKYSRAAESYWRVIEDEVNLAKTLLTQGNIYNHMHKPTKALQCFDESLEINRRIGNYGEEASVLGGKARAYILLKKFTEAKLQLDDAIALRKRYSDRRVCIEYENMGSVYESQGNLALALGWYKKALPLLEQYQPAHATNCRQKIKSIEKRL